MIQSSEFLNSTWGHAAVWFAALWASLLFIRKVSKDADNDLDPEKRKALGEELLRIKDRDASSWVPDFTSVFDRFFGKKHLSWKCFYRSALISTFVLIVLFYLYDPIGMAGNEPNDKYKLLGLAIISALLLNVFIDYISLLETRVILYARTPVFIKIILDAIITILLVFTWIIFFSFLVNLLLWSLNSPFVEINIFELVTKFWKDLFDDSRRDSTLMRITLATSFTTSIWLWLHGLSQVLIRSLSHVQGFMGWLNVKETPLRAIGTTINLIVLTFGFLLFPVYLLYRIAVNPI